jgi:hypothetical protein
MAETLDDLRRRMEAAAEAMDFEEAGRLRDQISLLRGRAEAQAGIAGELPDPSRLSRQQPGAMGLGTSDPAHVPPAGWTPPERPDPMTSGRKTAKRRRR